MSGTLHQVIGEISTNVQKNITNGSKCLVKDRKLGVSYSWEVRETSQYHQKQCPNY